jgi:transposase
MLWILRTGAPWRDLPAVFGPWKTVYHRFSAWRKQGVFEELVRALQQRLVRQGAIDQDLWCVDSTSIRAARCAGGGRGRDQGEPQHHALGYSRGGFGTKLHLVTDGEGVPLAAALTPGQSHETRAFERVMRAALTPAGVARVSKGWPRALAADKASSCRWVRAWLRGRRIERVIPQRSDQSGRRGGHRGLDREKYRRRHVIEQCVGWIKEHRRLATRYEKLATSYLAVVALAFVHRYLRLRCEPAGCASARSPNSMQCGHLCACPGLSVRSVSVRAWCSSGRSRSHSPRSACATGAGWRPCSRPIVGQ